MLHRKLAISYYQYLEITAALVTPKCIETHAATISDAVDEHERSWRKATNTLLVTTFFNLIRNTKIDFFVEIGAFDGSVSRQAESLGISNCLAFEANPFTHSKFKSDFSDSQVKYLNLGIADNKGTSKIKIPKHSSEMELPNSSFLVREEGSEYTEVEIQTIPIDSILDYLAKPLNCGAAWIDVEGYTYNLIKADNLFFDKINLLFLEVEDFPYWKDQKLAVDIIQALIEKGFVPLLRDYEGRGQYNIIFIKAELEIVNNSIVSDYLQKINNIPHNCLKEPNKATSLKSHLKKYLRIK